MNPFLLSRKKIGPLDLRPWTLTTQQAIIALEFSDLSEMQQVAAMAWLQSRDEDEVEQAVANGTALDSIKQFAKALPLALLKPLADWCKEQNQAIEEGRVDVLAKPGISNDDAPKN
jgi:hypothetical protein